MSDKCNVSQVGTIHVVTSFKEGDIVSSKSFWDMGIPLFEQATKRLVELCSGKGYEYVLIVKSE